MNYFSLYFVIVSIHQNIMSIQKQLLLDAIGRKALNRDVVSVIKGFSFETMKNVAITNEARRRKNVAMSEATHNMRLWRSPDEQRWGHMIEYGFGTYYITSQRQRHAFCSVIGAENCHKCGNYISHEADGYNNETQIQYPENIRCTCHLVDNEINLIDLNIGYLIDPTEVLTELGMMDQTLTELIMMEGQYWDNRTTDPFDDEDWGYEEDYDW